MQLASHLEYAHLARAGSIELAFGAGQLGRRRRCTLFDGGVEAITGDVAAETNPLGDRAARSGEQGLQRNPPSTRAMQEAADRHRVLCCRPILASAQGDARAEGPAAERQA